MASVSFIPIEVSREMRSREKPLWIGRPIAKKFALKEGWRTFAFGIPWTAAALYFLYQAAQSGDMMTVAFALPLAVIGVFFLTAPVQEYWRARRTTYVVSNQRLIILNGLWRPSVETFDPSEIGSLDIDAADDGVGSIIFLEKREWRAQGGWMMTKIGFKAIAGVADAKDQIHILKGQSQRGSKRDEPPGEPSQDVVENYRGYQIECIGDRYCVGDDSFADSPSAKAHIDANWARSRQ